MVARLGDFWVTSVRLTAQKGAPVPSGKDPLPLNKLTCNTSYSLAFQTVNDNHMRNTSTS